LNLVSPATPYGFTTFFDDLRQEMNGKFIYNGVYTGTIIVPTIPFILPSFVAMVTYRERPGESTDPVTLKVFVPGTSGAIVEMPIPVEQMRSAEYDQTIDFEGMDKILSMQLPLVFVPFPIAQEGFIRVRAYRGEAEIRVGALRIQLGTVPTPIQSQP